MIFLSRKVCLNIQSVHRFAVCSLRTYKRSRVVAAVSSSINKTLLSGSRRLNPLNSVASICKKHTNAKKIPKTSPGNASELAGNIQVGTEAASPLKELITSTSRRKHFVEILKGSSWVSALQKSSSNTRGNTFTDGNGKTFEQELKAMTKEEVIQQFGIAITGSRNDKLTNYIFQEMKTWEMSSSYPHILEALNIFTVLYKDYKYFQKRDDLYMNDILKEFIMCLDRDFESCPKESSFVTNVAMVLIFARYHLKNLKPFRSLLNKCETFTANNISLFSFEELAIVINTLTFYNEFHVIRSQHSVIFWDAFVEHLNKRVLSGSFSMTDAINVSVVFQFANSEIARDRNLVIRLASFLVVTNYMEVVNIAFLNKILLFFSKQKLCHTDLMSEMKKQFIYLSKRKELLPKTGSTLKHLSEIAWHYSRISHEEDSQEFYGHLLQWFTEMLKSQQNLKPEYINASVLDVMSACLIKDVFPEDLLKRFFKRELVLYSAGAQKDRRQRTIHSLIIQTSLDIEYPDYDGERLNKEDVEYTKKQLWGSLDQMSSIRAYTETLEDIQKFMGERYGEEFFHLRRILPFCIYPSIEMRIDTKSRKFVEFTPLSYDELLLEDKSSQPESYKRIMVVFPPEPKSINILEKTDLGAYLPKGKRRVPILEIMRRRLIQKLGYQVYLIPWRRGNDPELVLRKVLWKYKYLKRKKDFELKPE